MAHGPGVHGDVVSPRWAMRRSGVLIEPPGARIFGTPPLPPAPRVSLATASVPVAVRADLENPRLDPRGGRTHLRLTIVGGQMAPALYGEPKAKVPPRAPEEVWLYLDASGSMTGESQRAATAAAHVLVRRLRPEDRLAVVAYGERPRMLRAPRPVGDAIEAHRAVELLVAGGGAPVSGPPRPPPRVGKRTLARGTPLVLWITDGVGFAKAPPALQSAGARPIVTLVVGDGASAADLRALRATPGIDAHYVPDSRALASSIARALYAHRGAVAHDLEVVLTPAPGVRIVSAPGATPTDNGLSLAFPSLARGEERVVLAELEVPAGSAGDALHLADFTIRYREVSTFESATRTGRISAVRARDGDEALAMRDRDVARSVLAERTGAALSAAGEALARNDFEAARRALDEQQELLAIAATTLGDGTLGDRWMHRDVAVLGAYARIVRRAPTLFDEGARKRTAARMVFEGDGRMRR